MFFKYLCVGCLSLACASLDQNTYNAPRGWKGAQYSSFKERWGEPEKMEKLGNGNSLFSYKEELSVGLNPGRQPATQPTVPLNFACLTEVEVNKDDRIVSLRSRSGSYCLSH